MKAPAGLIIIPILVAACGGGSSDTTVPSTTPPATAPTTATTIPTSTSVPGDETPPTLTVWGAGDRYSRDGAVILSGTVDEPATVAIDGVAATTHGGGDGPTDWSAEVALEAGTHEIAITAEDRAGNRSRAGVTITVDPALEVELAYVTDFDGAALTADYVQWLTGEAATTAAREDGAIGADETLPNDFYIRNENPMLRTLPVAEDAPVVLQGCFIDGPCVLETAVTLVQWAELLVEQAPGGMPPNWQWYGAGALPYWLTLQDGVVVQIAEQYLP